MGHFDKKKRKIPCAIWQAVLIIMLNGDAKKTTFTHTM